MQIHVVTFGLIPEEERAEDYSSAVEAYDYVLAVTEGVSKVAEGVSKVVGKLKVACGLKKEAEVQPWQ